MVTRSSIVGTTPFVPAGLPPAAHLLFERFLRAVDPDGSLPLPTRQTHAMLAMRAYYARLEHSTVTDADGDDQRSS